MTLNIALQQEQQQRLREGLTASQDQVHDEASLNTDLYSGGFFDGLIGLEPTHPEIHSYWSGYETGYREYWAGKLSVEIPTQF